MASTYSNLKIELIGTGDQSGTWGVTTNTNLGTAIEEAITGSADVSFSSADVTLTLTNTNTAQTARNLRLNLTGTVSAAQNLIVPSIEKQYIVNNTLGYDITVKNSTGTGVAVPAGKSMIVFNTGSNVVETVTALATGTVIPVANGGTGQSSALVAGGVLYGSTTTAAAVTAIGTTGQALLSNAASAPSFGNLGVAAGGTGVTTITGIIKGSGTSAFSAATAGTDYTSPTGTENLSNKTITTSSLNSTPIGASSASTGAFTTLTANAVTSLGETTTVSATAATGTINYDVITQGVLYYTSNATANWTVNFRGSGTTSLNTLMAVGETRTVTFLVTQGGTAYYNNAVTVDGSSVTPKWQGGSAPTTGNVSGIDVYTYSIIKTASATFTVLASQTQFK
jgi:hypothetical protein